MTDEYRVQRCRRAGSVKREQINSGVNYVSTNTRNHRGVYGQIAKASLFRPRTTTEDGIYFIIYLIIFILSVAL